jgi:hypothetical protein
MRHAVFAGKAEVRVASDPGSTRLNSPFSHPMGEGRDEGLLEHYTNSL